MLKTTKLVKQYLNSITGEIQEKFISTIKIIEKRMIEEVFKTPLQSSYLPIRNIVSNEFENLINTIADLIQDYVEPIYFNGKIAANKKLNPNFKRNINKKYDFNQLDEIFINRYKVEKLMNFNQKLKLSIVDYINETVTSTIKSNWNLDDIEENNIFNYTTQELVDDEMNEILNIIFDIITSIYKDLLEIVVEEILSLYKRAELEEYKNLGVSTILIKSIKDFNSCSICKTLSKNLFNINDLIEDLSINKNIIHIFCSNSIEPIINYNVVSYKDNSKYKINNQVAKMDKTDFSLNNNIKKTIESLKINKLSFYNIPIELVESIKGLTNKINIYLFDFIKEPLNFYFVDDVSDIQELFDSIKEYNLKEYQNNEFESEKETLIEQNQLKDKILVFKKDNDVFVSNTVIFEDNIEDVIIREIMRNYQVSDLDWWKNKFEKNKISMKNDVKAVPLFINYLATQSLNDFILESIVKYINEPLLLKNVDIDVFEKIKKDIFNDVQFF